MPGSPSRSTGPSSMCCLEREGLEPGGGRRRISNLRKSFETRVPPKTRESPDLALDLALEILPHAFAHYATVISIASRATERNRKRGS